MHHDNYIQPHPCCETTRDTELTKSKQQGGNRGREEQLPKTHNSLHDSVFHEGLNPSFLGSNEDGYVATSLTPRHCLLPCSAWCAWTSGARPWPALPVGAAWGHARVCACYCNMQLFCQPAPRSICTTGSSYAHWWHGFLPKIRFLLIMITKAALQGKYFGIWALLALLFVRKLMASLALLSRWTM